MESSTIFGLLLIAALVIAAVIYFTQRRKKDVPTVPTAAPEVTAHLVEALRNSVPSNVHVAAIDALKFSVPAVTRSPIVHPAPPTTPGTEP